MAARRTAPPRAPHLPPADREEERRRPEDAQDSVAAAFASFLEKFDPDRGSPPLGWITLAAQRNCWAAYRRRRLGRVAGQETDAGSGRADCLVGSIPSGADDPAEAAERAEDVAEARGRLAALKLPERRTLLLIGAGYSYRETGEITGFSDRKVRRCAEQGRIALRAAADR
jgi:DNA-directed RNA polymerase specialized sigma24 family protein